MPGAFGDFKGGLDGADQHSIDELEEAKRVAEGAGADIIVVLFILDSERDAGHLFGNSADDLEPRGQHEIAERFVVIHEQRIMLVGRVLGALGQDGFHGSGLRGKGRQERRGVVQNHFPVSGFAAAGDRAPKTGGQLAFAYFAEVELAFCRRGGQGGERPDPGEAIAHGSGGQGQVLRAARSCPRRCVPPG